MPTKKRVMKKVKPAKSVIPDYTDTTKENEASCCYAGTKNKTPIIIGVLILIFICALAFSKGYIVVAIVNNKPIFRFQLNQAMMSRYGKQTLEGMISEDLIADEAKKKGISVSQKDIDEKEAEVLKSFGGKVTLEELLTYQGLTKSDFDDQIKLQLLVNKLLEKDVTVTDEEIATYQQTNKAIMVSSDEASLKEEAKKALVEQKINEKIQPWFTELKNKAQIYKFF